ncbi:unnamed protein product [Arabis nemorensis]|uniref:NYN domain-containing protein n=1 Tax=Arabis nemorensis TaxID=586526 RepID=A0A565C614_9BRAS|nr:unnamed protein product [Arabis nemorensis]
MAYYWSQYFARDVAVFWDVVECPISDGKTVGDVSGSIKKALKDVGFVGTVSIIAYGQTSDKQKEFDSAGVPYIHVEEESRAKKITLGIWKWIIDHRILFSAATKVWYWPTLQTGGEPIIKSKQEDLVKVAFDDDVEEK